ncbi:bleomycin resistance protein [Epidermidibacterium keratini]|uniref:Bleomycin resistance protein n=1 Tax=Epidermidibacterium keratini TaxID=1891644 RepID=A0A7L4YIZ9_9ACTN|nr:VOC family protein [Epidermidibacterium keratini]QHB99304.1 bleomycin resistance protein [Epidermidibacterium keratini]
MNRYTSQPSTIERAGHVALQSPDPAAAAAFAADHLGLYLVHVDDAGRHYLAANGLDPYSLVYTPAQEKGVEHLAYLVRDLGVLNETQRRLEDSGVPVERLDPNEFWRSGPALRVTAPAGHQVVLTTGVQVGSTMASQTVPNVAAPAPITLDHAAPRVLDPIAEMEFAESVLGLKESARVVDPEGNIVLGFYRSHTLFHCYTILGGDHNGLHHFQFTLKNAEAVHKAAEALEADGEVEMVWGPVRHSPGNNVALYFWDNDRNMIEYSAEEEIILDAASYVAMEWSTLDQRVLDEWGDTPPDVFLA